MWDWAVLNLCWGERRGVPVAHLVEIRSGPTWLGLEMIDRDELQCCNRPLPVVGEPAMGMGSPQHVVVSARGPRCGDGPTPLDVRSGPCSWSNADRLVSF